MASQTTLNAKNLEALGAERLAELLIEVSAGNAATARVHAVICDDVGGTVAGVMATVDVDILGAAMRVVESDGFAGVLAKADMMIAERVASAAPDAADALLRWEGIGGRLRGRRADSLRLDINVQLWSTSLLGKGEHIMQCGGAGGKLMA